MRLEGGMRVKNRGQQAGQEQHRQPGIERELTKGQEEGGEVGESYWGGKQRRTKCLGTRKY